ncbi:MAG: hypothetical protein Q9P14_15200 [candidate division KSB1 bacterium]|nr:hypothetical protein [candidate division KSB1 bacterium]
MRAGSESLDENLFNRPPLSETVRRQLLFLARQSIADALFRTVTAPFVAVDSAARFKSGAFVTLYEDEKLRGCRHGGGAGESAAGGDGNGHGRGYA